MDEKKLNEREVRYLTLENVEYYDGMTLYFPKSGGHHYPLKIKKHPTLGYCYIDKNNTMIPFTKETCLPYTNAEVIG